MDFIVCQYCIFIVVIIIIIVIVVTVIIVIVVIVIIVIVIIIIIIVVIIVVIITIKLIIIITIIYFIIFIVTQFENFIFQVLYFDLQFLIMVLPRPCLHLFIEAISNLNHFNVSFLLKIYIIFLICYFLPIKLHFQLLINNFFKINI